MSWDQREIRSESGRWRPGQAATLNGRHGRIAATDSEAGRVKLRDELTNEFFFGSADELMTAGRVEVRTAGTRELGHTTAGRVHPDETFAIKARDADSDGFVYDGTPRQRPALPSESDLSGLSNTKVVALAETYDGSKDKEQIDAVNRELTRRGLSSTKAKPGQKTSPTAKGPDPAKAPPPRYQSPDPSPKKPDRGKPPEATAGRRAQDIAAVTKGGDQTPYPQPGGSTRGGDQTRYPQEPGDSTQASHTQADDPLAPNYDPGAALSPQQRGYEVGDTPDVHLEPDATAEQLQRGLDRLGPNQTMGIPGSPLLVHRNADGSLDVYDVEKDQIEASGYDDGAMKSLLQNDFLIGTGEGGTADPYDALRQAAIDFGGDSYGDAIDSPDSAGEYMDSEQLDELADYIEHGDLPADFGGDEGALTEARRDLAGQLRDEADRVRPNPADTPGGEPDPNNQYGKGSPQIVDTPADAPKQRMATPTNEDSTLGDFEKAVNDGGENAARSYPPDQLDEFISVYDSKTSERGDGSHPQLSERQQKAYDAAKNALDELTRPQSSGGPGDAPEDTPNVSGMEVKPDGEGGFKIVDAQGKDVVGGFSDQRDAQNRLTNMNQAADRKAGSGAGDGGQVDSSKLRGAGEEITLPSGEKAVITEDQGGWAARIDGKEDRDGGVVTANTATELASKLNDRKPPKGAAPSKDAGASGGGDFGSGPELTDAQVKALSDEQINFPDPKHPDATLAKISAERDRRNQESKLAGGTDAVVARVEKGLESQPTTRVGAVEFTNEDNGISVSYNGEDLGTFPTAEEAVAAGRERALSPEALGGGGPSAPSGDPERAAYESRLPADFSGRAESVLRSYGDSHPHQAGDALEVQALVQREIQRGTSPGRLRFELERAARENNDLIGPALAVVAQLETGTTFDSGEDGEPMVAESGSEAFKDYSPEKRIELARKGWAIPVRNSDGEIVGGKYPIADAGDLADAISAFGRAKESDRAEVKRLIRRRAKALGKTDSLPESWAAERDEEPMVADPGHHLFADLEYLDHEERSFFAQDPEEIFNWVEKVGGLPKYIKRIVKHLKKKFAGDESRAVAVAVNAAKRMCSTGDLNFPGLQQVNPGSKAEACAAVADWERKKAQSHLMSGDAEVPFVFVNVLDDDAETFAAEPDGPTISKPFEILRAGEYKRGDRVATVTEEQLAEAMENWQRDQADGVDVAVDYDHSFATGRGSRAAGWYRSMERKGNSIFATVEWTAPAREAIANREYKYFSAEFSRNHRLEDGSGRGFAIVSGGLTNRPFLRGLGTVALDENAHGAESSGGGDTPREMEADRTKTPEKPKAEEPEATPEVPAEDTVKFTADNVPDGYELFTVEEASKLRAAAENTETFAQRLAKTEEKLQDAEFNEVFSAALSEGRIDASDETKDKWRKRFNEHGREFVEELFSEIPEGTIPVGRGTDADAEVERDEEAPAGVDEVAFTFHQKAEKLAGEKGIPYEQAVTELVQAGETF